MGSEYVPKVRVQSHGSGRVILPPSINAEETGVMVRVAATLMAENNPHIRCHAGSQEYAGRCDLQNEEIIASLAALDREIFTTFINRCRAQLDGHLVTNINHLVHVGDIPEHCIPDHSSLAFFDFKKYGAGIVPTGRPGFIQMNAAFSDAIIIRNDTSLRFTATHGSCCSEVAIRGEDVYRAFEEKCKVRKDVARQLKTTIERSHNPDVTMRSSWIAGHKIFIQDLPEHCAMLTLYIMRKGSGSTKRKRALLAVVAVDMEVKMTVRPDAEDGADECAICLQALPGEGAWRCPSCRNRLHGDCARQWAAVKHACPFCRGEMSA